MPNPKEIAWSFFQKLGAGQLEYALAMLEDSGTWWNVGPRTAVPMSTFKASAAAIMGLMPMRFTLHNTLAEGNTVLLELESTSPRPGGGTYNNRYCYVIEVADGRILHVREYPDTKYALEMLPPEAWGHEQRSWERHHGRYWPDESASKNEGSNSAVNLRLEDIELIRQVTYRYFRCVDTGDFAGVELCFSEDASVSFIGGSYRFDCQGREEILQALRSILHAGVASMHTAHHPEIRLTGAVTAEGIWYLTDWAINLQQKTVTHGACLAQNRYVRIADDWLIQHYGYTRIYEQVDELEQLPNITAHALADAWQRHGAIPSAAQPKVSGAGESRSVTGDSNA